MGFTKFAIMEMRSRGYETFLGKVEMGGLSSSINY